MRLKSIGTKIPLEKCFDDLKKTNLDMKRIRMILPRNGRDFHSVYIAAQSDQIKAGNE